MKLEEKFDGVNMRWVPDGETVVDMIICHYLHVRNSQA